MVANQFDPGEVRSAERGRARHQGPGGEERGVREHAWRRQRSAGHSGGCMLCLKVHVLKMSVSPQSSALVPFSGCSESETKQQQENNNNKSRMDETPVASMR